MGNERTFAMNAENAASEISAVTADWSRERCGLFAWQPGRQLLRSIRWYQAVCKKPRVVRIFGKPVAILLHRFWSVVSGADIPLNSQIGGGLLLPHPNGVVIHPQATIGPNCLFFQQVTIGADQRGAIPVIGGHVDIGAGAKIIGGSRLGDHACIGANAVVLCDVPSGCVAVGVPARVIPGKGGCG